MADLMTGELLVVFILGVLAGQAIGYWKHLHDTHRWHAMLQRLMVPFDERFASPIEEPRRGLFHTRSLGNENKEAH